MTPGTDPELDAVVAALRELDPDGHRTASVLRDTIDQLYDGQRTGRYRWDQLYQTEKTHCGTLVEINMQRKFKFDDGDTLDYRIAGVEIDCKFSQRFGRWMIPPEARGRLCLVLWASDEQSRWSMGVVRASEANLQPTKNRDQKTSLNKGGRERVSYLHCDAALPENLLLQLPREVVDRIFAFGAGAARVRELFRLVQRTPIGRVDVAAVGQQADYMKRIRGNGGARSQLRPEGIVILGQSHTHRRIAERLGLPVPGDGESVSARVHPCSAGAPDSAEIDGAWWRLAADSDPIVEAPALPRPRSGD
ncbi:MAG: NaeI family type II restriction endonuclease [bacterium]|nr:NaeI family type II restriction endonuclease [bacterium]MDE0668663.1 NaeI family type II restriction endonuclease [bacterium]